VELRWQGEIVFKLLETPAPMCAGARTAGISSCIHNGGKPAGEAWMDKENNASLIILVVEDVHEIRDGIEKLLKVDGYRVAIARDERDGIESAQRQRPDLILVSLAGLPREVIDTARRIREKAAIGENVPVVIFCIDEIAEGDEVAIGKNVHVARPDNFNQLRGLLNRLLSKIPQAAYVRNNGYLHGHFRKKNYDRQ
jgi:DNA-binding response OmpR family regulator